MRRNINLSIPSDIPPEMAEVLASDVVTAFNNRLEAIRRNIRKKEEEKKEEK